jgi:hypothetical protein
LRATEKIDGKEMVVDTLYKDGSRYCALRKISGADANILLAVKAGKFATHPDVLELIASAQRAGISLAGLEKAYKLCSFETTEG